MPVKRAPVTASPGPSTYSTPPPIRPRDESLSTMDFSPFTSGNVGVSEAKIISALVGRVVNKLPCNSGTRLAIMEVDPGVRHSVDSLILMVRIRQGLVLQALGGALETLSKYSGISAIETPLETLHSQLYILNALLHALTVSWRSHAESHPQPMSDLPRPFPDPPPLDEGLARYLIVIALLYARMATAESVATPGTSSPSTAKDKGSQASISNASTGPTILTGPSNSLPGRNFIKRCCFPAASNSIPQTGGIKRLAGECQTVQGTLQQMSKAISRIIFILSASNWNVILARVKSRITHLQTTIEDSPDMLELRLLEWSNLNRRRLSSVLQIVSSTFLQIRRPAQTSVASILRTAIWNWVDVNPVELELIVKDSEKIEGGTENLFDALQSASDLSSSSHSKRNRAFYPLMTMLLVISPGLLKKAAMGDMGGRLLGGLTKKMSFLDSLKRGLTLSKSFDACAACYVDLVRAAMCVSPSSESSGLRSLVHDAQSDLKSALFNSSFANEISDPSLLIDGLVALYRATPRSSIELFGKLLSENKEINRISVVQACHIIQLEDARLPWYPAASELREKLAASMRAVLKSQAIAMLGDLSNSKRSRSSPELPFSQHDTIIEILHLYEIDPLYAFAAQAPDLSDTLSILLQILSSLLLTPTPTMIRAGAFKCHVALVDAITTEDETIVRGCGDALWQALSDVSRQALYAVHRDLDELASSFAALRDVTISLSKLSERHKLLLANSTRGEPAVLLATVAIITILVSPDYEQLTQSIPALRALRTLTMVSGSAHLASNAPEGTNFGTPEKRLAIRCQFLDELSNLPPATGRQQQQRQFRKTYKPFALPSTGGIAMWMGCAHLAKELTRKIVAADAVMTARGASRRGLVSDIEGLDEGQSKIWQNLMLFLAATAGVCVYDSEPPPSLSDVVGKGVLPALYEGFSDPLSAVEEFTRETVDLLVSGSVHVRETVKDALGHELPPSIMPLMVSQMTSLLSHSVGANGITPSETFTILVDQIVVVLRLAIERSNPAEQPTRLDLGDLFPLLVEYLARLSRDESSLRIKIKFCQLVESALSKPDCVVLTNDTALRTTTLDHLIDWSNETQRDRDAYGRSSDLTAKTYKEAEQATLKAIVKISQGLALQALGNEDDSTMSAVKTRLFHRYYLHLVKTMERSRYISEDESILGNSVNGTIHKAPSSESASDLAIAALSNLLATNLDVGLKHCLNLAYHDDPAMRTVFMRLLTSMLQQGARFGGLSAKQLNAVPRPFLDVLTQSKDNLAMAVAICEVCPPSELNEISTMLFRVFEARGMCLDLVKILTEREIALTTHESDLFRANSITTRILTIFARTYGYNYVRATLQPLIHSLVEKPAECSFELDPSKAGPNDDIERNADHLQLMCQALLDLICASSARAPILFRAVCHHLWEVTADKFPESRHSVVGSFIFLRFFCPAIVAPESIDLDVSPDTREVRRALLLITKVIQNLANNVTFGNKEPHMKVLNGFLSENIRQVSKFLSGLSIKQRGWELTEAVGKSQQEAETLSDPESDEAILNRFVLRHRAKLDAALLALPTTYRLGSYGKSARVDLDGKAVLHSLKVVCDMAGQVTDVNGMTASARRQAYDDFIRHNIGRNTDSVAAAFYEGPANQNGIRIFYFIVSRVGLVDYDLLAFHIFSLLDQVTDFFDLVIDLTDFSPSNELPMAWLKRSLQMCPPGILPCINILALYNPNSYAKRRVRPIVADLSSLVPAVGKQVVAASSPAELAEFIPFSSLALPDFTMALAYEADHVFTNLLCLSDHERQVPVVVKLGHDCVQIASWRKQELTPSLRAYIIDVIKLRDIDDILSGGSLPPDHLLIKYGQNESITFVSRKRNEMAEIIRAARSRLREGPTESRTLRPSDVPGTLLNVSLLNLSSADENLRLGAYNLVYELSEFFKWDMPMSIPKVTVGLNIPQNCLAFVHTLSSSLARSAPSLTPEFLKEWTIGFSRENDVSQQCAALHYVTPWLANLESFTRPSKEREDVRAGQRIVSEVIRALLGVTVAERRRLHLSIQQNVWAELADSHETVVEIVIEELIHAAIDAGFSSEKAECAADILVSMGCTAVRGRVIARLRKAIASTYLKPTSTLTDNPSWPEISTMTRILLALSFNPISSLDAQLFLPDLLHIITLLLCIGPLLIRQTVYGLAVNVVQSLAAGGPTGEMDILGLQRLLKKLQGQDMMICFGYTSSGDTPDVRILDDEVLLTNVEKVTAFLSEVLECCAVSIDCANAWRARWMSLVTSTCFQHNPATQPQAFTVLGHLASGEVDDDTVYQILVAMSTTLSNFAENDDALVVSMLKCLCRIVPGLPTESRYAPSLFWLSISILQLNHVVCYPAALELLIVVLRERARSGSIIATLLQARLPSLEPSKRLDQLAGLSFDAHPGFSFVGVIYKCVRHPSTRNLAIEAMSALLSAICATTAVDPVDAAVSGHSRNGRIVEDGVGLFIALLPVLAAPSASEPDGQFERLKVVLKDVGVDVTTLSSSSLLDVLTIPDKHSALLIVTLATTILQTASLEAEKIVLYRLLAEASVRLPDTMSLMYDSLIPRLTAVLSTTSTVPILESVTTILQNAMSDPNYTFSPTALSEIASSFNMHSSLNGLNHTKSYTGSISSLSPSIGATGARDQALEDLGMRDLSDLSLGSKAEKERRTTGAKCVAAIIDRFTS